MDITKTYNISFPKEKVYAAWISSNTIIPPATAMDILPEVGGHYPLIIQTPQFTSRNEGHFLMLKPNSHIRYTWEWDQNGEITEIDVRFESVGADTKIIIQHTGFQSAGSAAMHDSGWDSYIQGFSTFLAN